MLVHDTAERNEVEAVHALFDPSAVINLQNASKQKDIDFIGNLLFYNNSP